MNSIFADYTCKFVFVFLDDILVYSNTLQEHEQHLRLVLARLWQHQLFAKASKCSFAQPLIEYLGHVISKDGVATDPEKTKAMQVWPTPTNATELRGFLGLTGYYHKFAPRYGNCCQAVDAFINEERVPMERSSPASLRAVEVGHGQYTSSGSA
jgi:hypothetical protein